MGVEDTVAGSSIPDRFRPVLAQLREMDLQRQKRQQEQIEAFRRHQHVSKMTAAPPNPASGSADSADKPKYTLRLTNGPLAPSSTRLCDRRQCQKPQPKPKTKKWRNCKPL